MRPQVVIIAGPNGAGKSTLAPLLLRDRFGLLEYVNADTIALGLSAFQPEQAAIEAGRVMLKRLRDLSERQESFAFESRLASRTYAFWLKELLQQGYQFHLMFIWLNSPEIAIQRVAERVRDGGHNIPEETIRRRYRKGLLNFFSLYQELAGSWGIYDNSVPPSPLLIATGLREKVAEVFYPELWAKFCEAADEAKTKRS
jgi:predicted ABC-type ATPase